MKTFKQYLAEKLGVNYVQDGTYRWEEDIDLLTKEIKEKCQPFIKAAGNLPMFRCMVPPENYIRKVRKDRQPQNSLPFDHDVMNAWFDENFGVKHRSESLFVAGGSKIDELTELYHDTYYGVFPIGDFKFVWSPEYFDVWAELDTSYPQSTRNDEEKANRKQQVLKILTNGKYSDKDLQSALRSGNEMMIECDEYVIVPADMMVKMGYKW